MILMLAIVEVGERLRSFADSELDSQGFNIVFDITDHESRVEIAVEHVRKDGLIVVGLLGRAGSS